MSRTPAFRNLRRAAAVAAFAERAKLSTDDARAVIDERRHRVGGPSRRELLQGAGAIGVAGVAVASRPARANPVSRSDARIAIIGGGLAGLSCAYELQRSGITADIYEANTRVGGRCYSLGGDFPGDVTFPGQVVERGGELIDTGHRTMLSYANEFGLTLEDYDKSPGEGVFYARGEAYEEADVVDEYREFVTAMHADLRTLSNGPTADFHTTADELLDYTTLADYLDSRGAGPLLRDVLESAYVGEYGRELDEQSALNLVLFIHADRSSNFREFGQFSDERYHIVGGNQQVAEGLRAGVADQITYGATLVRIARTAAGATELTFEDEGGGTYTETYDLVVLAVPFSTLRYVDIDGSVALPGWKRDAIDQLQYGTNSKLMVGFDGRPWADAGGNGAIYAYGLDDLQSVWETNYGSASATRGVLTAYSGGTFGAAYDPSDVQGHVARFLADLDRVVPGAAAQASLSGGVYRAHLEKWSTSPFTRGSYTCNHPGYFTTIADREGTAIDDKLFFAGEHTDSFYSWQGYMEGAALSGNRVASEILTVLRHS